MKETKRNHLAHYWKVEWKVEVFSKLRVLTYMYLKLLTSLRKYKHITIYETVLTH